MLTPNEKIHNNVKEMQGKPIFYPEADCWRVEFSILEKYRMNKSASVIAKDIKTALEVILNKWPEATVHKVFKSQSWGNEGVFIATET